MTQWTRPRPRPRRRPPPARPADYPRLRGHRRLLLAAAAVSGHWPVLLRAALGGLALVGFYLAGLFAVVLILSGRATRKQQISFGPFMILGAFLVILL
jgi:hypothetical protein